MTSNYKQLTPEQVTHFLEHGYVRIEKCFTPEKASQWTSNVWQRLGFSPNDPSTWTQERINMPHHRTESITTFAPKAWDAMCDLLGGAERIAGVPEWSDGLIVNLGTPQGEGKDIHPKELTGWHVDGDFFVHFLDSPEQGLLVIPLLSDIKVGGGGTMICPSGIGKIAKHLYDHPEGVSPKMTPWGQTATVEPGVRFTITQTGEGLEFFNDVIQTCDEFAEATGNIGDVYLLHPLMMHSASNNKLRIPRIIINPAVSVAEPFRFGLENPDEYTLVERKTLRELGKGDLKGWKIQGKRETVVPERLKAQAKMKEDELRRLKEMMEKESGVSVTEIAV